MQKPKRRAYLLKRKAITTGFFDSKTGKDDKEKSKFKATSYIINKVPSETSNL